jgi:hypothetical protein
MRRNKYRRLRVMRSSCGKGKRGCSFTSLDLMRGKTFETIKKDARTI